MGSIGEASIYDEAENIAIGDLQHLSINEGSMNDASDRFSSSVPDPGALDDENAQFALQFQENIKQFNGFNLMNFNNEDSGLGASCSGSKSFSLGMKPSTSSTPNGSRKISALRRVPLGEIDHNGTPIKSKKPLYNKPRAHPFLDGRLSRCKTERNIKPLVKTTRPLAVTRSSPAFGKSTNHHLSPSVKYQLPITEKPQVESSAFKSISAKTLSDLMKDEARFVEEFILIDCRYPYEFDGGHVKHAINIHSFEDVKNIFYNHTSDGSYKSVENKRIPIFYCEFSQVRGVKMCRALRSFDRTNMAELYPHLDYPEIYLLDHGYRNFFKTLEGDACEPKSYVEMHDKEHIDKLQFYKTHRKNSKH